MDDFIQYRRAINNSYGGNSKPYTEVEIKYLLNLGNKLEMVEVKRYEFSDKNSRKLVVNGVIPVYLAWKDTFRDVNDSEYGVYSNKKDVLDDIVEYYKKKQKLLSTYKRNYENTLKYIKDIEKLLEGNEEYLI